MWKHLFLGKVLPIFLTAGKIGITYCCGREKLLHIENAAPVLRVLCFRVKGWKQPESMRRGW
jgi:hypothetical protein